MKKHIASIITASRIVFGLPLLFIPLSSTWFYALYLLCGFTDMVDGTVARKTHESAFRKDLTSETIPPMKTRQRRRNVHGCTGMRNVRKTLNFLSRSSRITHFEKCVCS